MSNSLWEPLQTIIHASQHLLQNSDVDPEQLTFLQHIQRTVATLNALIVDIPPGEYAFNQIFPQFIQPFQQRLPTIYGYAKLLLDSPQSFGDSSNAIALPAQLQAIYENGAQLAQVVDEFAQSYVQERLYARKAPPQFFDLHTILEQELPLLRYWVKEKPIQLYLEIAEDLPSVYAQPYHVIEGLRHIIKTIALEMMHSGTMTISACSLEQYMVEVGVLCDSIVFTQAVLNQLFGKDGRAIYYQNLQAQGGSVYLKMEYLNAIYCSLGESPPRPYDT